MIEKIKTMWGDLRKTYKLFLIGVGVIIIFVIVTNIF